MPAWEGERLETDMGWNGEGPFYYTALPEPLLSSELARIANPASQVLTNTRVDSVTFQPCLEETERSQDRHFSLAIPGVGLLTGVFDGNSIPYLWNWTCLTYFRDQIILQHPVLGHGGHAAADFAVSALPGMISDGLITSSRSVDDVSRVLYESICALDKEIQDGVTGLFANDVDALAKLSEGAVDDIVRANYEKLLLGMTGTTALIALVDEKKENLWIANLGDCQAGACVECIVAIML
jgi:pyruvate dehydrogenase phosphatase